MTGVPEPGRDPGAAAERTRLAWRRTGMSAAVCGLLLLHAAYDLDTGAVTWIFVAFAMVAWVAMIALAYRRVRGLTTVPPIPGRRVIPAYAALAVALAVLGGLVVML